MDLATARYVIRPVDPELADALRATATEVVVADSHPGWPCRQCLRDAEVGEELVLVSYDPFEATSSSPYRSAGPIFLHREPCATAAQTPDPPVQLTSRLLSVRAFDGDERMQDGRVVQGGELQATLDDLFADPGVVGVHVHNAGRGCFAARVERI